MSRFSQTYVYNAATRDLLVGALEDARGTLRFAAAEARADRQFALAHRFDWQAKSITDALEKVHAAESKSLALRGASS